ncbi:MAG: ASKHA domain-containing protein [Candidatus Electrothrix aestuarii]|uniref:ASKHA domain-containing protein n=1 Tax=Candidatus Electrothrix aestuarii TaxID=3062594 RepID=A0AAU8LVM3_9BACT
MIDVEFFLKEQGVGSGDEVMNGEQQEYTVTFLPSGRTSKVPAGTELLHAARKVGLHVNASCGGAGVCGKCQVIIEEGSILGGKSEKISAELFAQGYRQACSAQVCEDVTVRVPESSSREKGGLGTDIPQRNYARRHVFDMDELKQGGGWAPSVEKVCIELLPPTEQDNRADAGRLLQALSAQYGRKCEIKSLTLLQKMSKALRQENFRATATLEVPVIPAKSTARYRFLDIQPGYQCHRNFGLAFDIGTTTVYGVLIDLETGKFLAEASCYNPQMSYGEDVISRIICAEKPDGLELMQKLVIDAMNQLIAEMLEKAIPSERIGEAPVARDEINSVSIAGNTTMTHLLLHMDPSSIRRSPYVPTTTFFPSFRAREIGLQLSETCASLVYPTISSYVGGDIVAGVMASGMYSSELLTLFIDVGTNAEIVIGNRDWLACAACSAGPAFEGGGITHGIRAVEGAISDFSLHPETLEPMNVTEGGKAPIGICGSGLLIIVATLFEHGVLNQSGKFNPLAHPRIREGRSGREYVLAWENECAADHDIVINEVDIENFIRAKGAIFAGITTVLEQVGLQVSDLERIILAGGFGSYIDLDSAMSVGLLPEVDPEKILYLGNGSLTGSWMCELSNHIRRDVVEVVRKMTSFELSEVPGFKDQYMASMFLPHTDLALFPDAAARKRKKER